jgi:hypothetical protein
MNKNPKHLTTKQLIQEQNITIVRNLTNNQIKKECAEVKYHPIDSPTPTNLSETALTQLQNIPGVVGIGNGLPNEIIIFIQHTKIAESLPKLIEGKRITWRISGEIHTH